MGTCSQTSVSQNQESAKNKIFLNKKEIVLNEADFEKLHILLLELLEECDDFYEKIVTNKLVNDIKNNENFLEVIYANQFEVNIGNKQSLVVRSLFIPLSGRYQSNNELTFFCGNPGYSIEPYINSKGFDKLDKVIKDFPVK